MAILEFFGRSSGWYGRTAFCFAVLLMSRRYFKYVYPKYRITFMMLVVGWYIKNYKYYRMPFAINGKEDLENMGKFFKHPIIEKEYVSKRMGCKVIFKMTGTGDRIILCANGVGAKEFIWFPIIKYFADNDLDEKYTSVTWYYRGLFGSEAPRCINMTVRDFAQDCMELLEVLREERGADTNYYAIFGWSTGVQVALEFALLYPKAVKKLILMAGTHGHTLQTVGQPLIRLPLIGYTLHAVFMFMRKHAETIYPILKKHALSGGNHILGLLSLPLWVFRGRPFMRWFVTAYFDEFFTNGIEHSKNYFTILGSLDQHSVYSWLGDVEQETLILTGYLDIITPSFLSYELHSMIPNSIIRCWSGGTHFLLLEYPEDVSVEVAMFLESEQLSIS